MVYSDSSVLFISSCLVLFSLVSDLFNTMKFLLLDFLESRSYVFKHVIWMKSITIIAM